jgi:hypothetical protein
LQSKEQKKSRFKGECEEKERKGKRMNVKGEVIDRSSAGA